MSKLQPKPLPDALKAAPPILNPRHAGAAAEMVGLALLRSPPCAAQTSDDETATPRPDEREGAGCIQSSI